MVVRSAPGRGGLPGDRTAPLRFSTPGRGVETGGVRRRGTAVPGAALSEGRGVTPLACCTLAVVGDLGLGAAAAVVAGLGGAELLLKGLSGALRTSGTTLRTAGGGRLAAATASGGRTLGLGGQEKARADLGLVPRRAEAACAGRHRAVAGAAAACGRSCPVEGC